MPETVLSISALAERTQVKVETIRYYEQVGLLPPPARSEGNQRRYLRKASRAAELHPARARTRLPVEQVRTLLNLSDTPAMPCDAAHAIASARLEEVRQKIARLRSLEQELARIARVCDGGGDAGHCAVIESLAHHEGCLHAEH